MTNPTPNYWNALIYEQLIQKLGNLFCSYYGTDDYMPLIEDIEETYGHHITMKAEDFATDLLFGVIDNEGNEII